jgi:hypothetical protein
MIKFFRKFRQKLLSENKFSNYLIYAVGEIVLVVIGILIALQINNWNENRKANENFILLLSNVRNELAYNIELSSEVINYNRILDTLAHKVLNNRLVKEDYKNNPKLFRIGLNYQPIYLSRNAFSSLIELKKDKSIKEKSIISDLKFIYSDNYDNIQRFNLVIEDMALKFNDELRLERDWAYQLTRASSTDDLIENEAIMEYYINNPFYLNNVDFFWIISVGNMMSLLIPTRNKLINSYINISEYLGLEKDISIVNDPVKFKYCYGTYKHSSGWTYKIFEDNNQILIDYRNPKDSIVCGACPIYFDDKTNLTIELEGGVRFGELKFDVRQNVTSLHTYFGNRRSNFKKIE